MRRLLAAVVLAVVLLGCGGPTVHSGTVLAKHHDPPYETTTQVCILYGKYGCQLWQPEVVHHPDRYRLYVEGVAGSDTKRQWRTVDEYTWESTKVGSQWSDGHD